MSRSACSTVSRRRAGRGSHSPIPAFLPLWAIGGGRPDAREDDAMLMLPADVACNGGAAS